MSRNSRSASSWSDPRSPATTIRVLAGDLGSDQEEALSEFRDILRERGEV